MGGGGDIREIGEGVVDRGDRDFFCLTWLPYWSETMRLSRTRNSWQKRRTGVAAGGEDGGIRLRRTNCPTVRKRTASMLIHRSIRSRPNWTLPLLPTAAVVAVVAVAAAGLRLLTTSHYCSYNITQDRRKNGRIEETAFNQKREKKRKKDIVRQRVLFH